ncbi:MAG: hypothetical protein COX70_10215 [Flavobacteriales bacterium CG_4_10_14_0_2_um_filter_32_8]|nr:MAG: hypothetical protein COX70_10215 [Flavobacteriales bacterium CG_4_10_14_0_2_um_filter_32_8]PJB13880.1 MAG: hypothetical protein CO118_11485 [Flavobacteriales bacterium CG_4_9_14_3_um_filter_32_8]
MGCLKPKDMENKMYILEPLFEKAEAYGKISYELYKLKTLNKSAAVVSTFVSRGSVVLALVIFMVFANIGLALLVGDLLGKLYLGFFCMAGFYVLLGGFIYFFMNNYIKRTVSNVIISEVLN